MFSATWYLYKSLWNGCSKSEILTATLSVTRSSRGRDIIHFYPCCLKKQKQTKHTQKPTSQAKRNPFSCVNIVWASITLISYLKPTLAIVGNCYCVLYLELLCGAHTVIKIFKIVFGSGNTRNEIHSIAINSSWTSNSRDTPPTHAAWLSNSLAFPGC